jgi:hypothetical protein
MWRNGCDVPSVVKKMHYKSFSAAKTAWLFALTALAANAAYGFRPAMKT